MEESKEQSAKEAMNENTFNCERSGLMESIFSNKDFCQFEEVYWKGDSWNTFYGEIIFISREAVISDEQLSKCHAVSNWRERAIFEGLMSNLEGSELLSFEWNKQAC